MEIKSGSRRVDPFLQDWYGLWKRCRAIEAQKAGVFRPVVLNMEVEEVQAVMGCVDAEVEPLEAHYLHPKRGSTSLLQTMRNFYRVTADRLVVKASRGKMQGRRQGQPAKGDVPIACAPPIVLAEHNAYHMVSRLARHRRVQTHANSDLYPDLCSVPTRLPEHPRQRGLQFPRARIDRRPTVPKHG